MIPFLVFNERRANRVETQSKITRLICICSRRPPPLMNKLSSVDNHLMNIKIPTLSTTNRPLKLNESNDIASASEMKPANRCKSNGWRRRRRRRRRRWWRRWKPPPDGASGGIITCETPVLSSGSTVSFFVGRSSSSSRWLHRPPIEPVALWPVTNG